MSTQEITEKNIGMIILIGQPMNKSSIKRVKALLGIDNTKCTHVEKQLKGYGLGNKRTLQDYENYIGVRFINRIRATIYSR